MMKLKRPTFPDEEKDPRNEDRYLVHCSNVAIILAHADSVEKGQAKIREYLRITSAEQRE